MVARSPCGQAAGVRAAKSNTIGAKARTERCSIQCLLQRRCLNTISRPGGKSKSEEVNFGQVEPLWLHNRAVHAPHSGPGISGTNGLRRMLDCFFLANVDAKPRLTIPVEIPAPQFGRAGQQLMHGRRKMILFLYAEAGDGEIDMVCG